MPYGGMATAGHAVVVLLHEVMALVVAVAAVSAAARVQRLLM